MALSSFSFDQMLPSYFTSIDKSRIRKALEQFFEDKDKLDYTDFFSQEKETFLMQSDVVHSVVGIDWNDEEGRYKTGYTPAILISNSCDVTIENDRTINSKEALFAPIMSVADHLRLWTERGSTPQQLDNFQRTLKRQEYTNLFYLPPNPVNGKDYMVRLDKIHWVPQTQLKGVIEDLENNRFISLSDWGYYLFLTKITLHVCRVPEEIERRSVRN
jgi:hypothetical protein